jgi:predicted dehydrogenase
MNVAVVGTGTMGREHLEAWSRIDDAYITGVIGRDKERTQALADQYHTAAYTDLNTLLAEAEAEAEVEMVDICLPTDLHLEYVRLAAQAGKAVICEKPLGRDIDEAQAIIDVCREHGVPLYVGHVVRFFPEYENARRQVQEGQIGQPGVVRLSRGGPFPQGRGDWYADEQKSGGVILDMAIHDLDWLRWTFGEVKRVMAKRVNRKDEQGKTVLEYALLTLRMADGTIAHVEASWAQTAFKAAFEIAGDQGMLVYDSDDSQPLHVQLRQSETAAGGVAVPESVGINPYQRQLEHFKDCLLHRAEPLVSADDAWQAVRIARAALESIEKGQPITLQKGATDRIGGGGQ